MSYAVNTTFREEELYDYSHSSYNEDSQVKCLQVSILSTLKNCKITEKLLFCNKFDCLMIRKYHNFFTNALTYHKSMYIKCFESFIGLGQSC